MKYRNVEMRSNHLWVFLLLTQPDYYYYSYYSGRDPNSNVLRKVGENIYLNFKRLMGNFLLGFESG